MKPQAAHAQSCDRRPACDPLAAHLARRRIDRAQYLAGQEFQRCYRLADRRRPDQLDGLDDDQRAAWKSLDQSYKALGADGSALVNDVLIHGMTTKQIAEARGLTGQGWEKFLRMRLRECLGTLAQIHGFTQPLSPAPPSARRSR
jgi:hypothetical protein